MGCGPSQLEIEAKERKEASLREKPATILGKLVGKRQQQLDGGADSASVGSPTTHSMSPTYSKSSVLSPKQSGFSVAANHRHDSLSSSQKTGATTHGQEGGDDIVLFVKSPPPPSGLESPQPGKGNPLAMSNTSIEDTSFRIDE